MADANSPKRPHKKGKRKVSVIGRSQRAAKHRQGQVCGRGNCRRLIESRVWDRDLGAYVSRD